MSGASLVGAISRLVDELPLESAERLADVIATAAGRDDAQWRTRRLVAHPRFAERRDALFAAWSPDGESPAAVALGLRTAIRRTRELRDEVRIEVVWTGPAVAGTSLRRTEQALHEVISRAERRLLVVSYAVYRQPLLRAALIRAAGRGVALHIVVESPEESAGRMSASALSALGAEVLACSTIYVWPAGERRRDVNGHAGVLHAKCALADRTTLLVSSANLTESAMTSNIELGLLVRGGPTPGVVSDAFDELRARRTLLPVR